MKEAIWHNLSWEKVTEILKSHPQEGLKEREVKERQKEFGFNLLPQEKPFSKLKIFLSQFKSPLIYILVIAGFVTLILKEFTDAIVIFGAIFLNTLVGFFQENKASQALAKLKKVVRQEAKVIREGNIKIIEAWQLVPGDIFLLEAGDKVPADGRLIESLNLKVNEMSLTGEWLPTEKTTQPLPKSLPLADRDNLVFMGTGVEDGKGKAIVIATGQKTEIGKVALLTRQAREEKTPLQKKLTHFSKIIGILIGLICLFIFLVGLLRERPFLEMFTTAVAVAVAAIPEGLPVALTVILALGMERILRKKGLVRKLIAAETLGNTSIICADKTLTLTEGKMEIAQIFTWPGKIKGTAEKKWSEIFLEKANAEQILALTIGVLTNEAFIENPQDSPFFWKIKGRPTDRTLIKMGALVGLKKPDLEKKFPKIGEIPFNPQNKFIASLNKKGEKFILFLSGAPEKILKLSAFLEAKGKKIPFNFKIEEKLNKELENLTQEGLRVIALAYKEMKPQIFPNSKKLEKECQNLIFVGFIGLRDPLRKEAKEAIEICKKAGMRPILVTGDHLLTAKAVAKELGLRTKEKNVIEGEKLDKLSEKEFQKIIEDIDVYARVEPRHKLKIVKAWQKRGKVVAMTGDGINDAPALKQADIGVALGSGTDVAKEVSDLILLPDSFNIIVLAIEEGRAIIDNIRKVITYLLASSFAEVILIASSLFFGWPLPVLAVQILWINLIEDGPLSLSLAFEPKEKDLMKRKPETRQLPLLNQEMKAIIFIIGIILNLLLVSLFWILQKFSNYDIGHIRTIIFVGLVIGSIFFIFSCKSLRHNLWQLNPFSNKFLIFSWFFSVIMVIGAVYLPPLQILLKTQPLNFFDWLLLLGLGGISLGLIEITKWYFIAKSSKHSSI